jgi:tetratricopeptide (TPR) repeat protein
MLRTFARERLAEAGELDEARLAHAEAMAGIAARASMEDRQRVWTDTKIVAMLDDMRAAIDTFLELRPSRAAWMTVALVLTWRATGRISEGMRWTAAAMDANPGLTQERSWLLRAHASLLVEAGNRKEAERIYEQSISIDKSRGATSALPFGPAVIQMLVGDYPASEGPLRRLIQDYMQTGDTRLGAAFLNTLASSLLHRGRTEEARELAQRSVEIRRSSTLQYHGALDTLAQAHALLGDADEARICWLEATPMAIQQGAAIDTSGCFEGLALAAGMRKKKETALRLHFCAEHLLTDVDLRYEEPIAPKLRELVARLQEEFGPEIALKLRAEGEALSPAEALHLAATEG